MKNSVDFQKYIIKENIDIEKEINKILEQLEDSFSLHIVILGIQINS